MATDDLLGTHTTTEHIMSRTTNGVASEGSGQTSTLDASRLEYHFTSTPRPIPAPDSAEVWGMGEPTDHMIQVRYNDAEGGWATPQLVPYGPLTLMPMASTLHYATQCFEGMKLYRGVDGKPRLFRPELNAQRMRESAARVALPDFPADELVKLIEALAIIDAPRWLPRRGGAYLYIRPTFIATQSSLGIKRASEALLYIMFACFPDFDTPAGSLAPAAGRKTQQTAGVRLLASEKNIIRAWPGGFGDSKVGANYGPSIIASAAAAKQGFDQILWLMGDEGWITEAGLCNFFTVLRPKHGRGRAHLITAPLDGGVILPGVTRASVLETARDILAGEVEVVERNLSIHELIEAAGEERLVECFVCGTAFFVAPVGEISFEGKQIIIPRGDDGVSGTFAPILKARLREIMHGEVQHPWGHVVESRSVEGQ